MPSDLSRPADESLTRAAASGDREALGQLIERNLPGLEAFIRLRGGRLVLAKESASDLVQSVCREVLQDLGEYRFQSEALFRHWLYQTAERKILDRARFWQRARRDARREAVPPQDTACGMESLARSYAGLVTPSAEASMREQVERVERAFQLLSEDDREVIVLARVVGLSQAEIAAQMGRTEASVRNLLPRALARLGGLLW